MSANKGKPRRRGEDRAPGLFAWRDGGEPPSWVRASYVDGAVDATLGPRQSGGAAAVEGTVGGYQPWPWGRQGKAGGRSHVELMTEEGKTCGNSEDGTAGDRS